MRSACDGTCGPCAMKLFFVVEKRPRKLSGAVGYGASQQDPGMYLAADGVPRS
jgi:hypothetical protein